MTKEIQVLKAIKQKSKTSKEIVEDIGAKQQSDIHYTVLNLLLKKELIKTEDYSPKLTITKKGLKRLEYEEFTE